MRRAIPVIAATAGGLALVANFHTHPAGVPLAAGPSTQTTTPPAPTSTAAGSASPPSTAATAPSAATRTLNGPVITTEYGPVQVRVTMKGTQLVDVQALQLPSDRSRSARISQYAGPQLRTEALQAQSANIDLVSGATYTTQGYIDSLQGALDLAAR
jgi:uncharacterized protein with FMN-binding domain